MTLNPDFVQAPAFTGVAGEPNLSIAIEAPADSWARERLLDEAFGPARSGKTAERLREGCLPAQGFALAAKDASDLVGTLRMWHIMAGDVPALLLGPLAVAKAYRSRGLGRRLMAKLCSVRRAPGTKPFCSSAIRLIMRPMASAGGTRAISSCRDRSMRRVS